MMILMLIAIVQLDALDNIYWFCGVLKECICNGSPARHPHERCPLRRHCLLISVVGLSFVFGG